MKRVFFILTMVMPLLLCFSCKKSKSLSELRREERQSISKYIKDNNIEIIREFPTDTVFAENQYFLDDSTGLYIQVIYKGEGGVPTKGDEIVVQYYEYTMTGDLNTAMWTQEDLAKEGLSDAPAFTYNVDYKMAAFNYAAAYLQNEGEAYLIVPSEIGFSTAQSSFTAYRYHIRYKIKG